MVKVNELSVFFPLYNEEGNAANVTLKAKHVLEKIADKWEIILVNDGSADSTLEVARELAQEDKRIKVINHKVNRGYGGALKSGYEAAKYSWVAFTDGDGQFDFSEINKFLKKKKEADLILGYRLKRADSLLRKMFTWGWGLFPRILFGLKVKDYSCGFWLIKKEVYDSIQPLVGEEKVTKIEMLVKAKRKGYRFAQVGVHHYPRETGHQTGADVKVVIKSVFDLINLWTKLR
jgi:glycosyltransferase involved in cell wall biosynthesis